MALPRAAVVRAIMLNHWYHQRGQLAAYLRLLDEPVPSIYGRAPTRTRSCRADRPPPAREITHFFVNQTAYERLR